MAIVQAEMSFLEPWPSAEQHESPYLRHFATAEYPATNFKNETYIVDIVDARPNAPNFTLDHHGFAFRESVALDADMVNAIRMNKKDTIENVLYPATCELVKEWTSAKKVVVFDYGYRRRDPDIDMLGGKNAYAKGQPATVVRACVWVEQSQSTEVLTDGRYIATSEYNVGTSGVGHCMSN